MKYFYCYKILQDKVARIFVRLNEHSSFSICI